MSENTQTRLPRLPKLWEALVSFAFLIFIMAVALIRYGTTAHVPMVMGVAFTAVIALRLGHKWKDIEKSMLDGIYASLPAVVILCVVGALIGVWILGGIVPSMIYFGLGIINPQFFLVTVLVVCSITSLATGTSWGTAGTLGIAFMGIAEALGIPLGMAAGAVVSGAYFGDKISPLSDTTNVSSAVAGTDTITHIKFMIKNTIVAYIITLIIFLVLGFQLGGEMDYAAINLIKDGLQSNFNINPALLLAPVAVILAIALKIPALPGIFIGLITGVIFAMVFQGVTLGEIFSTGYAGFNSETGIFEIDRLLSRGGMLGVTYAILLIIPAMCFGGVMEMTKQLEVVVEGILLKMAKGVTTLTSTTVFTALFCNVAMAEQYMAVILPNKMFAKAYRQRGWHPKMMSAATDTTGTLTSALIPWNTCGAFMMSVLGVSAFEFAPFAFFNWLAPLTLIVLTGFGKMRVRFEDEMETINALALSEYEAEKKAENNSFSIKSKVTTA